MRECQLHPDCFLPCPIEELVHKGIRERGPGVSKWAPKKEIDAVPSAYHNSKSNRPTNKRKFRRLSLSRKDQPS